MNIQDKFETLLKKNIPDHLEVVNNRQFANTGIILIQPHESFECVLMINYSFQDTYCTLEISPAIGGNYRTEKSTSMIYVQSPFEKLELVIEDINNYLLRP